MEYRIPPHNTEAEQGVLASLLLDKDLIPEFITLLKADDFYKTEHQEIYQTIVDMYNSRKLVDIITVSDKMGIEWLEYFTQITGSVPTTQNAKHYAGIVRGKSIRRQYIDRAKKVIDMSYDGDYENVTDFRNDVMAKMDVEIRDSRKEDNSAASIVINTMKRIEERYRNDNHSKMHYGYTWLDQKTGGAHNSELTILAARPSVGKTALSTNVSKKMAIKGNNVAVFNLEMDKENLMERIFADEGNVHGERIRYGKTLDDADWEKLGSAAGEIGQYKLFMFDNVFKIEEIRAECRALKNKGQLDFVVVDYLQLVETMRKVNSETERVSYCSRQFKLLAKELKVPIWLLSQINRENEKDNRRPKLIDLRQSGSIEQDADNVFFLHDANYGKYTEDMDDKIVPIELIIAKQRNGKKDIFTEIGYQKSVQRFVNLEVKHESNNTGSNKQGKQQRARPYDN